MKARNHRRSGNPDKSADGKAVRCRNLPEAVESVGGRANLCLVWHNFQPASRLCNQLPKIKPDSDAGTVQPFSKHCFPLAVFSGVAEKKVVFLFRHIVTFQAWGKLIEMKKGFGLRAANYHQAAARPSLGAHAGCTRNQLSNCACRMVAAMMRAALKSNHHKSSQTESHLCPQFLQSRQRGH